MKYSFLCLPSPSRLKIVINKLWRGVKGLPHTTRMLSPVIEYSSQEAHLPLMAKPPNLKK